MHQRLLKLIKKLIYLLIQLMRQLYDKKLVGWARRQNQTGQPKKFFPPLTNISSTPLDLKYRIKLIQQYSDEATIRECSEAPSNTTCNAEEKAEGDIDGPDDHEEDEAGPDLGHAPVRLTAGHLTHLNGQGVHQSTATSYVSSRNFSLATFGWKRSSAYLNQCECHFLHDQSNAGEGEVKKY